MTEEEKALELEFIAPQFTRAEINEFCSGRRYEDYRKAKLRYLFWRAELALWRQKRWARKAHNRETRFVDGVGQHTAHFADEFLEWAMRLWYGRDCWSNKDKREFIYRKFPFFRVPAPQPRIRVKGFRPDRAAGMVPGENPRPAAKALTDSAHETPAARSL